MSKYTTELRYIIKQAELDAHQKYTEGEYTNASYEAVGLSSYPIFDEGYRAQLNNKIMNHFYMREIGFETVGLFRFHVKRTMNEIMSYYNIMYEAIMEEEWKPFLEVDMHYDDNFGETKDTERGYTDHHDIDQTKDQTRTDNLQSKRTDELTTTRTDDLNEKGSNASTEDLSQRNVYQDTPMSLLETGKVQGLEYATSVTYDDTKDIIESNYDRNNTGTQTTDNTGTQTTNDTGTQKHLTKDTAANVDHGDSVENWKHGGGNTRHEYGRRHSQAYLLKEFMDAMINLDMMVIADLETLFMGVW